MAIKWEDYNLPSFKLGYNRNQPVPFKTEVPYTGNAYVRNCNNSVADLPVYWDVTVQLTNQQALDFNVFLDDFYAQETLEFTKVMYTEVGPNTQSLTIVGPRPQAVSSAHNLWTYQFRVYSGDLSLQVTPVPDPPVIPPYPQPGEDPDNFQHMPPEFLNTGALNAGDGDFFTSLAVGLASNRAVVATNNGRAARTADGGVTWTMLPRYLNSGVEQVSTINVDTQICISDDGSTIIAGFTNGFASISRSFGDLFVTLERGLRVTDGDLFAIQSICCSGGGIGSNQRFLVLFANGRAAFSQDQGYLFNELPYRFEDGVGLNYVSAMSGSAKEIIVVDATPGSNAKTGYVHISTDGGNNWSESDHLGFSSTEPANDVAISRGNKTAVICYNDLILISNNTLTSWVSADLSFLNSGQFPEYPISCAVSSDGTDILVGTSDGRLFNTKDSGSSWQIVEESLDPSGIPRHLGFAYNYWMALSDTNGYISDPDYEPPGTQYPIGQAPTTWSQLTPRYLNSGQTGGAEGFMDITPDGENLIYVASAGTGSQSGNGGDNFTQITELGFGVESQIPGGVRPEAVCMSDDGQRIYVVCRSGYAGRTIDGGATWEEMPRGLNLSSSTDDIDALCCSGDGMTVFVGGNNGEGAISYNGGDTWSTVLTAPNIMLSSAMSVDGQTIVSVHYGGGVTVTDDAFATTASFRNSIGGNNVNITDVCCDETGDKMLLTKANGEAHLSVDKGVNWSQIGPLWLNTGNTVATDFHCAMSYDGNVMLVGAGDGYFAYSDDGGANWNQLPQHLNSGGTTDVTDISTNGREWLAVFQAGYVAISRG